MSETFPSKRDAWIMALLRGAVGIALVAFWDAWNQLTPAVLMYTLPLTAATCALLLWFGYGTFYRIEGSLLLIRCGPIRSRVPLAEIRAVVPSRNPFSAPACSLDRLHVRTRTGRGVLISPQDKAGFLRALAIAASQLRVEGDSAVLAES